MHLDFLSVVKGGFLLLKEPLECVVLVYTNSETSLEPSQRGCFATHSERNQEQQRPNDTIRCRSSILS
jgi:hypothetical protein